MACPGVNRLRPVVLVAVLTAFVGAPVLLSTSSAAYAAAGAARTWSAPIAVEPNVGQPMSAVACPSTSQCTATDLNGRVVTFDPTSPGTPVPTPVDAGHELTSIACPSTTQCTAVDDDGRQVTFDPTLPGSPTPTVIDSSGSLVGVACPSTTQCTAVGSGARQVTFNPLLPGSPTPTTIDNDFLTGVACPSTAQCTAVDISGRVLTFDPSSPGSPTPTDLNGDGFTTEAIACPSTTQCTTVDSGGFTRTFNPTVPSPTTGVSSATPLASAISCPSTTQCTVVGADGRASGTVVDSSGNYLTGVACPTTSQCTAVDDAGLEVTFNPTSPGTPTPVLVDRGGALTSVACPTATQCTAAGNLGREVTFDPAFPGTPTPVWIDSGHDLNAIACPSATQCTAVDDAGRKVTFDPTSPGNPTPRLVDPGPSPGIIEPLFGVACPSTTQCNAVDLNSRWVTFDPDTTSAATPISVGGVAPLTAVACPSTSQCTTVSDTGYERTFNPTTGIVAGTTIDTGHALNGVACPSTSQCTAVDDAGRQLTFNPASPGTPTASPVDSGNALLGIACPATDVCVAVDSRGNVVEGDPASPGTATVESVSDYGLRAVSCSSTGYCVAVDGVGNAYLGVVPPEYTVPPSISGTTTQGQLLTESHGSWTNSPTSYTYQWQRCDGVGDNCVTLDGATSQTYTLVAGDVGQTIRVQETASNAGGSGAPATSAATAVVVPPPPSNQSVPTISGTAVQGQLLTESHGSWTNSPTGYDYQWQRCDNLGNNCGTLAGAIAQTYTVVAGDVGHTLRVQETASNAGGSSAPSTSAQTPVVTAVPVNVTKPSISGQVWDGGLLTEAHGTWTNSPTGYAYQWQRCDQAGNSCGLIAGATNQNYTLVSADVGHTIRVQETASNASGSSTPATSDPIGVVSSAPSNPPTNLSPPTISGTAARPGSLIEDHGSWTNSPTSYAYQWLRCDQAGENCAAIAGETLYYHILVTDDIGHTIRVQETASNADGPSAPATSDATAVVVQSPPSTNFEPVIQGTAAEGQLLTELHAPTWSNGVDSYAYEWQRCDDAGNGCAAIASATQQTYTLVAADVGHTIRVKETATNVGGSGSATSAPTAVVVPLPPSNVDPPFISGTAASGNVLTESHGSWTKSPTSYAYQWLRCDNNGGGCSAIGGATNQTYPLVVADVGHAIRVQETASNAGGSSAPAVSVPTGVVQVGDGTAPQVALTGPAHRFQLSSKVVVGYGATDAGSGVASYDVRYRSSRWDGGFGAYQYPTGWQHTTARTESLTGSPGRLYCFSVRARDNAGNLSSWSAARCAEMPLDDRALDRSGSWTRGTGTADYLHTRSTTTDRGAALILRDAKLVRLAVVLTTCPTCGKINVSINGNVVKTIDTHASTTHHRVLVAVRAFSLRTATIRLTARPGTGHVVVDGLGTSRV